MLFQDTNPQLDCFIVLGSGVGAGDHKVGWNFHKFLVNERGELVAALGSGADPLGSEIKAFASAPY